MLARLEDDDEIVIECIGVDHRLGIVIDKKNPAESSWFAVYSDGTSESGAFTPRPKTMKSSTEFKECAACAAKPGSPTLCASCVHNRKVIDNLGSKLTKSVNKYRDLQRKMSELNAKYLDLYYEYDDLRG